MTNEEMMREIGALPPEGKRLVESFIAFVRQRYAQPTAPQTNTQMQATEFVGMWRAGAEMTDGTEWVSNLRQSEWA